MYSVDNFNVPQNWEAVFSQKQATGDFIGDPPVNVHILIGWLVDTNGVKSFVSPDKVPAEYRKEIEKTPSATQEDATQEDVQSAIERNEMILKNNIDYFISASSDLTSALIGIKIHGTSGLPFQSPRRESNSKVAAYHIDAVIRIATMLKEDLQRLGVRP